VADEPTSLQAGYRREALPDPDAVGEDGELVARIRAEIEAGGPITFARFMERALYEPGHGYYRRPEPGPGTAGDFLTAPEAHPIFGASIGRLLEQAWEALGPTRSRSRSPAPTGALAAACCLHDLGSPMLPPSATARGGRASRAGAEAGWRPTATAHWRGCPPAPRLRPASWPTRSSMPARPPGRGRRAAWVSSPSASRRPVLP
jgi:hypothetical protein